MSVAAPARHDDSLELAADRACRQWRLDVEVRASRVWPQASARHRAVASGVAGGRRLSGYGAGPTPAVARGVAVVEWCERWAQFAQRPAVAVTDTFTALGRLALDPEDLGLYTSGQYGTPGFGLRPFTPDEPLDWVEATGLADGRPLLVPVEFVYPWAETPGLPLVAETSSGAAAHTDRSAAVHAALCELVERDALMLFWHRRPPTPIVAARSLPDEIAGCVRTATDLGFIVTTLSLRYDIQLPTFLACALRERRFCYGLGADHDEARAVGHAFSELGAALEAQPAGGGELRPHFSLDRVRDPEDHRLLYDGGPLSSVIRDTLAQTAVAAPSEPGPTRISDRDDRAAVLAVLDRAGLKAYVCDITPAELAECGIHAVRVLVPGLVPLSFGFDRLRLGCRRLVGPEAPGRLSTLLPHFVS